MTAREDAGLDLDALEAVANAATPGPWEAGDTILWDDEVPQASVLAVGGPITWDDHSGDVFKPQDAAHIAAFDPPTVLALIARVRGAEATIARVRSLIAREGGTNINIVNRILDELEGSPS